MRCTYCSGDHGAEGQLLGRDVCEALAEQLPPLLMKGECVDLLWHGGEPTLLPPQTFAELHGLMADSLAAAGYEVKSQIQSNGLHISPQWHEQMRRLNIHPGISMDGPAFLHDTMRLTASGQPTCAQVADTVRSLSNEGLPPSLLCVVTQAHVQHVPEIVQWLEEWNLPVRFNPLLQAGRSTEALEPWQYFVFLRELFTQCSQKDLCLSVAPLNWMVEAVLLGKNPTECSYSGNCGRSILSLYPDGSVGTCGRSDVRYGNILHTKLDDLLQNEQWQALQQRQDRLQEVCGDCWVRSWCNGGCPEVCGVTPDPQDCAERRAFFSWLGNDGLALLKASLLREKSILQREVDALQAAQKDMACAIC